jgi:hypothetical protein
MQDSVFSATAWMTTLSCCGSRRRVVNSHVAILSLDVCTEPGNTLRCDVVKAPFDIVHVYVYNEHMKKRELEKALRQLGWTLLRHGRRHLHKPF